MSNQQALNGESATAHQNSLKEQANLFLFDLRNEATEHGFKTGESWTIELVTDREIRLLKRTHHPVISLRLQPHVLLPVYQQVKSGLKQSLDKADTALTAVDLAANEKQHLVAYPQGNNTRK